jgi:hypothetical protein
MLRIVVELADVQPAIEFHIETCGLEVVTDEAALLEAFMAEGTINYGFSRARV